MGAFLLAALHAADGQRSQTTIGQLDHTVWSVRDGAPSYVNSLAQTPDGVLWIGTVTGLYRFDGVRFEQFMPPPSQPFAGIAVNQIAAMPDSSVWVGFANGGVSVLTHGRVINHVARDGLLAGRIYGIARDSTGDTWVSSGSGLARLHDGRWQRIGSDQRYPSGLSGTLYVDRRGTLWVPMAGGVYVLHRGESRFTRHGGATDPKDGGFRTLTEAPDGSVWGASLSFGLTRLSDSGGRPTPFRSEIPSVQRSVRSYVDRRGNVWMSAFGKGLIRVPLPTDAAASLTSRPRSQPTIEKVSLMTGLAANAMLQDRDGNMWVATGGGLERFRETALSPVILPKGLRWPTLAPAADGSIWVASYGNPVSVMTDRLRPIAGAPTNVTCVFRDLDGGLWLGGAGGIWNVVPSTSASDVRFMLVAPPREGRFGPLVAMARSLDGDLWVSNSAQGAMRGLFRRHGTEWSRAPVPPRWAGQAPFTVVADSAGGVWLGYQRVVIRLIGDSARVYSDTTRLPPGPIDAILARGDHLWIGGTTGLVRLENDRFHRIAGTPTIREITGIVETANGDVWLNGTDGVTHIPVAEIQRALNDTAYRVHGERFDEHDGLTGFPVQTIPRPTAIQGTDGRLWFTTSTSVAWIDPAHIARNPKPPPVQVRALTAAGKTYDVRHRASLPARTTQLQLAYTAINLAKPNRLVFRYRLSGVDTAWVDAGTRRDAYYTNLRPGSYRFRVIAANEDGVWNEAGASIDFDIPPTFTQTKAFVGLMAFIIAASLVGAGWLLSLWRQRQMARTLHIQFEGQLAERARVARELHDTLLGDMTGVAMQLGAAVRRAASATDNAAIVQLLSSLSSQVQHTVVEARRSVTAMRKAPDGLPPLHLQLDVAAQRTFAETGITAHVEQAGSPRPCPPHVESEIVGIATEAMANARQHAGCQSVTITCSYAPRQLKVRVRDDGQGFDLSRGAPAGHWGLVGMRERAASIGAKLSVTSAPGSGTEVALLVPDGPGRWMRRARSVPPTQASRVHGSEAR
jgi:signal transduction histidine kinase